MIAKGYASVWVFPYHSYKVTTFLFTSTSQLKEDTNLNLKTEKKFQTIISDQVEGLFNKLDLKTHPNMSPSVKQSKLRLSSDKITKENLTDGLKEMRKQRTKQRTPLQEVQFGSNIASTLFKQFIE
ncbi:hypothetical protein GLOIN_2v1761399 [Rhizophagus irregularis DAOM 181602=DAOM 197198]|nr:hypothetical protein GLOIN_2v1761399 [Rhizophagus irregularis DAOM 181602=DAOM 197198]